MSDQKERSLAWQWEQLLLLLDIEWEGAWLLDMGGYESELVDACPACGGRRFDANEDHRDFSAPSIGHASDCWLDEALTTGLGQDAKQRDAFRKARRMDRYVLSLTKPEER